MDSLTWWLGVMTLIGVYVVFPLVLIILGLTGVR